MRVDDNICTYKYTHTSIFITHSSGYPSASRVVDIVILRGYHRSPNNPMTLLFFSHYHHS
ncbi:hypothetical protein EON63_04545 [archaeon]|nr:MAG: hypothetical protein EON63_04545 [archaeon]